MKKFRLVFVIFLQILISSLSVLGQHRISPEDYIKIINLLKQNRIDIVKQELIAKNFILKKDIPPYHYENQYITVDLRFEYPFNDSELSNYTNPEFNIFCTEEMNYSTAYISFMNTGSCDFNNYAFNELKRFIKYDLHVNNLKDRNFDSECWNGADLDNKILPDFTNSDFDVTFAGLLQMSEIYNSGYSSLSVGLKFCQQKSSNIIGLTKIPIRRNGNINIISVDIGGKRFDYMIDTGASFLTISGEIERHLKDIGVIRTSDYKGETEVILADGSKKKYTRIVIPKIKIGELNIENIDAIIIDEGSLLLGKSVLDKFREWKIDNVMNQLIIE